MKTKINRFIFEQIGADSGSLNVLSSIIHKFPESGQYYGFLYKGRENVGKFGILVRDLNLIKNSNNDHINQKATNNDNENNCKCNKKEDIQRQINIDLYKIDISILDNLSANNSLKSWQMDMHYFIFQRDLVDII